VTRGILTRCPPNPYPARSHFPFLALGLLDRHVGCLINKPSTRKNASTVPLDLFVLHLAAPSLAPTRPMQGTKRNSCSGCRCKRLGTWEDRHVAIEEKKFPHEVRFGQNASRTARCMGLIDLFLFSSLHDRRDDKGMLGSKSMHLCSTSLFDFQIASKYSHVRHAMARWVWRGSRRFDPFCRSPLLTVRRRRCRPPSGLKLQGGGHPSGARAFDPEEATSVHPAHLKGPRTWHICSIVQS
jgi:hypothetical protein